MRFIFIMLIVSGLSCGSTTSERTSPEPGNFKPGVQDEPGEPHSNTYSWLDKYSEKNSIKSRIHVPEGYTRVKEAEGSFASWLRFIQLKEGDPEVHLYDGTLKNDQSVHFAVVDLDVGKKDLQQCADAVMRLRAEYLFSKGLFKEIHFNYTSGDKVSFTDWCGGKRPSVKGNKVVFVQTPSCTPDHQHFMGYMENIFSYCGTLSLSREMKSIALQEMMPGDVFLYGGTPGHGVLVMDVAVNDSTGDKVFLIAQSYMPAQEMHILKNPRNAGIGPWYSLKEIGEKLVTPEWTFGIDELKRFQ